MSASLQLDRPKSRVAPAPPSGLVQRRCACGGTPGPSGECAGCRARRLAGRAPEQVSRLVDRGLRTPPTSMDDETRRTMEARLGHRFDDVRIHAGPEAAAGARAVSAHAYTSGSDVVFGAGRYEPGTSRGRGLLAHELAHVVQQRSLGQRSGPARVAPAGGVHEDEARRASEAAVRGGTAPTFSSLTRPALQRAIVEDDGGDAGGGAPAAGPAAPVAAPCTPAPVATLDAFRATAGTATSAENCCVVCPANLGVGAGGQGLNGMEMRFEIANHCPGAEYDITRVRQSWFWHRVGGVWTQLAHEGPGVNDDHHDDDECLRLRRGRYLYVIDSPGWPAALPFPLGSTFPAYGTQADPAATEVVAQDNFAEWVIYRHRGHGIPWTRISSPTFTYWHSVNWFERTAAGWRLQAGSNQIVRGSHAPVVTP